MLCSFYFFVLSIEIAANNSSLPALLFFVFLREFTISLCSCQGTVVGSSGLEPPTSRLSGARSNQLSYEPFFIVSCLRGGCCFVSLPLRVGPQPFSSSGTPCCPQSGSSPSARPGGDERVRTAGLLLARQALYQLSYTPTRLRFRCVVSSTFAFKVLPALCSKS